MPSLARILGIGVVVAALTPFVQSSLSVPPPPESMETRALEGDSLSSTHATASTPVSVEVRPSEKFTVRPTVFTWDELVRIQASLPVLPAVRGLAPTVALEPPVLEAPPSGAHVRSRATNPRGSRVERLLPCAGNECEPVLGAGFDAQLDVPDTNGFSFIPPDVAGAVGPDHLMTMLENKVLVQDRLGAAIGSVDLNTFWSPLGTTPLTPTTAYPRVHFDALDGRWLASLRNGVASTGSTSIFFALSQTDDPTGAWDYYSFLADAGATSFADWVLLGYNGTWITITANMLTTPAGATLLGAKMWAIDKATALVGGPLTVSVFPTGFMTTAHGSGGSSVHPARTFDGDPTLWLVNNAFTGSDTFLYQLTRITGTGAAPVVSGLTGSPFGGTSSFCYSGTAYTGTQRTMTQVGETRFISPFSVRTASVAVRNGKIWIANSGGLPGPSSNASPTSNGIVWNVIDPTLPFPVTPGPGGMVVQTGAITDGIDTMSLYPSIAVNCAEDVLIGFANGNDTISPRACYTTRLGTDAPSFMGAIQILKAGESTYWKNFGVGMTAQYGRYTSAAVDPNDDRTLWTLQQYADTRVGPADDQSRWGTWWGRIGCPCDDLVAPLDEQGHVILPPGAVEVTDEIVEMDLGLVEDLYPDHDTSLDLWYEEDPCDVVIGEEPPPADATDADVDALLAAAGITGATAEEIIATLAEWEEEIANKTLLEPDVLSSPDVPPATGPYTPPAVPHSLDAGECYVLGGRDLVFVHGLQIDHILDKIAGNAGANTPWVQPTTFPGSTENPEFYDADGYYKEIAVNIWHKHICRFLKENGIKNRFLIVPYSCSDRLEVAAQSVLTQIGDAMRQNIGVRTIADEVDDPPAPFDFGTPSFVILSHSTGGAVVDVALSAAASNQELEAGFIPAHCKAHIALHGALSGSRHATAAIVAAGFLDTVLLANFPWVCPLVSASIAVMTHTVQPCPIASVAVAQSILVDLVPLVMQLKWGDEINSTPVRTVTVIGGHPSYASPIKTILLPGFDDGVANINSQVGNPNSTLAWPSGFIPEPPGTLGWPKIYDRGVSQMGGFGLFEAQPNRAIFEFIEQVLDPKLQPAGLLFMDLVSGGATPFVSPTGMLQPVGDALFGGGLSTLNRYENHFSFLQSASHHFGPNGSFGGFNGPYYSDTAPFFLGGPFGERNWEETRVITDARIYDEYDMVYPGDDEPLLTEGLEPKLHEVVRGRVIKFKLFGKKFKWWVWKRRYHLLDGAEALTEMDYVYRYLLTNPNVITWTCPCATEGITDDPDDVVACVGDPVTFQVVASSSCPLTYQWRKDGVDIPGETSDTLTLPITVSGDSGEYDVVVCGCCCKTSTPATLSFAGPSIATQPVGQRAALGVPVSFTVVATGAGALSYQWRREGNPIPFATSDTYSIAALTTGDYGDYTCIVTDVCGSVTSDVAGLQPQHPPVRRR